MTLDLQNSAIMHWWPFPLYRRRTVTYLALTSWQPKFNLNASTTSNKFSSPLLSQTAFYNGHRLLFNHSQILRLRSVPVLVKFSQSFTNDNPALKFPTQEYNKCSKHQPLFLTVKMKAFQLGSCYNASQVFISQATWGCRRKERQYNSESRGVYNQKASRWNHPNGHVYSSIPTPCPSLYHLTGLRMTSGQVAQAMLLVGASSMLGEQGHAWKCFPMKPTAKPVEGIPFHRLVLIQYSWF